MTRTFAYEFSTTGTPQEAEARLQAAITNRLRRPTGGSSAANAQRQMRLRTHTATSLSYRPKLLAPLPVSLSIWIGRRLRGEKVDVQFAPNGGNGQTRITVSGKVGGGSKAVADREFWTGILGASETAGADRQ